MIEGLRKGVYIFPTVDWDGNNFMGASYLRVESIHSFSFADKTALIVAYPCALPLLRPRSEAITVFVRDQEWRIAIFQELKP